MHVDVVFEERKVVWSPVRHNVYLHINVCLLLLKFMEGNTGKNNLLMFKLHRHSDKSQHFYQWEQSELLQHTLVRVDTEKC